MRKQLKRRSVQRLNAIFKEGRSMFPKGEFTNVSYLGNYAGKNLFAAKEGRAVGGLTLVDEATWS